MKKKLFLSLTLLVAVTLYAGRLDKAFEALDMHDYFRAKELFEKSIKSDAMLSHYGLSIIYSRNNNPFYNLDSAYAHIERSLDAYELIKPKDLKKLIEEENINKDTLYAQRQNVASLALDDARKRLSIASIEYVIQKYPFSSRYDEAIACRDSLAFALTEKQNTWTAYKSFMDTYPRAVQVGEAQKRYGDYANWILYRLTDVMLMEAEALVERNDSVANDLRKAFDLTNAVYSRSNLSAPDKDSLAFSSYGTQSEMRDLVLLERQRELMFEGKRWFDLVRKARREGTNGPMLDLAKRKYNKPEAVKSKWIKPDMLYLPIYEEELKVNTLLKQNPEYKTTETISTAK